MSGNTSSQTSPPIQLPAIDAFGKFAARFNEELAKLGLQPGECYSTFGVDERTNVFTTDGDWLVGWWEFKCESDPPRAEFVGAVLKERYWDRIERNVSEVRGGG